MSSNSGNVSNGQTGSAKAKSEDGAIVGAFVVLLVVASAWIWLVFGFVQPLLDRVLYGI